jgi:hypothetical protein
VSILLGSGKVTASAVFLRNGAENSLVPGGLTTHRSFEKNILPYTGAINAFLVLQKIMQAQTRIVPEKARNLITGIYFGLNKIL